jgi:hypothetical protein
LRQWGKEKYKDKPSLYRLYFGEDKVLKAYENNKRIVFVCLDKYLAKLMSNFSNELKRVFKKEVTFIGKEEEAKIQT